MSIGIASTATKQPKPINSEDGVKVTHQLNYQSSSFIGRCVGDRDRYQIEAHLGKGGMGDVYRAIDTRLGKRVAIKLLNASLSSASTTAGLDFKRRFERECAICAALKSENIVQVSDYGITADGQPFYVMEYLEGQTLEQVLKQEPKLSIERTRQIIKQVCAGLKSAHEGITFKTPGVSIDRHIKIIHRDLKPANIFLVATEFGDRVKIIDFGVAKIQSLQLEDPNLTSAFLGTYHYAAPEQFDCQANIDERSDIYCLGIILYEILAGVDPFGLQSQGQKVTGESWVNAHLLKPVMPLRSQPGCEHLSVELEQLVMRCLEKHPQQRFPSVQLLAQALDNEQSASSNQILSGSCTKQHKIDTNQSSHSDLDFFKLKQKFKNIQQWIVQNFHFKEIFAQFQILDRPELMSDPSSKASSRSSSATTFLPSAVNSETLDSCQAELAIYEVFDQFQILNQPELISELQSSDALRHSCLPIPSTSSTVNLELIDNYQTELAIYIGPIAKLVIEQTLKDPQYRQQQKFIEALASYIPDADKANCFRRTFLASNLVQ